MLRLFKVGMKYHYYLCLMISRRTVSWIEIKISKRWKNKCAISDKHKFSSLTVFYLSFSDCLIYSSPIALLSLFRKAVTPKEPLFFGSFFHRFPFFFGFIVNPFSGLRLPVLSCLPAWPKWFSSVRKRLLLPVGRSDSSSLCIYGRR